MSRGHGTRDKGGVFWTLTPHLFTVYWLPATVVVNMVLAPVLIFGLASTAVGSPGSTQAIACAIFPLSSPLVMVAHAAERPEVWPHLLALAWQALWVGLILWVSARIFRRSVLKSGPQRKWWKLGRV